MKKNKKKSAVPEPYISIIIPIYNSEKFLQKCLDSVVKQTLKNIEIICINDGSTDHSLQILKRYSKKDKRLRIINQKNFGQSVSLNNGLKLVRGKYVAFLDSDDWLDHDAYKICYRNLKNLDLDILITNGVNVKNGKEEENIYWNHPRFRLNLPKEPFNKRTINNAIFPFFPVSTALSLYKTTFLENKKILFPKWVFQDNLFFTKAIINAERIYAINDKIYHRRIQKNSITQNFNKHIRDFLIMEREVLNYINQNNFDYKLKYVYNNYYLSLLKEKVRSYHGLEKKDIYRSANNLFEKYNFSYKFELHHYIKI